jgi:CTD kinase subunit beta
MCKDAATASLFHACKVADTLKKSKEILCAGHNLKVPASERVAPDDPVCTNELF